VRLRAAAGLVRSREAVLYDGEGLDQHEVLVDHADPGGDRVFR
jgi:hypothetical protein